MVKDAERNRSADEKRKQDITANNEADQAIYAAEKAVRDFGEKMNGTLKSSIEKQIEAVRKAKDGKDVNKIKSAVEELQRSIQQIGSSMYEQPDGAGAGPQGGGSANGEDVIEGEVID